MRAMGSESGGWCSRIDEDEVFLEFLNVSLHLVHIGLQYFFASLFADSI